MNNFMKWYYNVKLKKMAVGLCAFSLVVATASFVIIKSEVLSDVFGKNKNNNGQNIVDYGDQTNKNDYRGNVSPMPTLYTPLPTDQDVVPTPTILSTITPEQTPTSQITPSEEPTPTLKPTPTQTIKPTPTHTKKPTPTHTKRPTPTPKPTKKPTSTPTKKPSPVPTKQIIKSEISVQYMNGDSSTSTKIIYPVFKLMNKGSTSVNYSDISIRYYYTLDGNANQTFWCDMFEDNNSSRVLGSFVPMNPAKSNSDYYLKVYFSSNAGSLAPGESKEIRVGFNKNNWGKFNQSNDYSFNSSSSFINWNKITVYLSGKLVYGKEP